MLRYNTDLPRITQIILPVLADTLTVIEQHEWIQNHEAIDHNGQPTGINYLNQEDLDEICGVCLVGAMHLAIRQNDQFPTYEAQIQARSFTRSFLTDLIREEPEAQRLPDDAFYPEPKHIHPSNWQDELPNETGEQRVKTLLARAIATAGTLPKERTK